tara:strand:- start:4932 stop:5495 length:564 start_codon:yes stop_codon:yes gene_type:complete
MTRTLTTEMQAVATAEVVRPFYLLDLEFDSGDLYLWTGLGDLTVDGNTYTGVGTILGIQPIEESSELSANGASFTLSGVQQALLALARDEDYQGRPVTLKLGAFDDNGDVISDPVIIFSGFMDVMSIEDGGETGNISLSAENKLISFERASIRRYTDKDQQLFHPGDKGFEFVTSVQEKDLLWGRKG